MIPKSTTMLVGLYCCKISTIQSERGKKVATAANPSFPVKSLLSSFSLFLSLEEEDRRRKCVFMLGKRTRPVVRNNSSGSEPLPNMPEGPAIKLPSFLLFTDQDGTRRLTSPLGTKNNSNYAMKSPRGWQKKDSEGVGLGIVAAMNNGEMNIQEAIFSPKSTISAITAVPVKNHQASQPIPIASALRPSSPRHEPELESELSESYTCVISHHGPNSMRKHEYFFEERREDEVGSLCSNSSCVFFSSPPRYQGNAFLNDDFLKYCYLCRKRLQDLDIYMYRGDKAFCSVECRCQQIMNDEYTEKRGPKAVKHCDYSASPCSAPRLFSAGVAVA